MIARLLGGKPEFAADALVDVFGEGFGHLDRQPMQIEVILVSVVGEPFASRLRGAPAHRHKLESDDVALGIVDISEEIGDAEPALLVLARKGEARDLALPSSLGRVVEQDHVIAFGGAAPIAVGGLRHQDVLANRDVANAREDRTELLFRPRLVFGEGAALFPVAPLELVEHALVEIGHDRLGWHAGDRLRPPKRRQRHRYALVQLGAAQTDFFEVDGTHHPRIGGAAQFARLVLRTADVLFLHLAEIAVEIIAGDAVHQRQPVEGVARIGDAAARIGLDAILLDIAPGQRGAAEHDRHIEAEPRHLFQILAHDDGRFDEEARHADRMRLVLDGGVEDLADRLLDAEIDDAIAVIGQDNVDQILADVVHITPYRRQDDNALFLALDPLHERFEIAYRRLHRLGRLQHEWQLHLAGAKQIADRLHAAEQDVVDDVERRITLHRQIEIGFELLAIAIDDALREPIFQLFRP